MKIFRIAVLSLILLAAGACEKKDSTLEEMLQVEFGVTIVRNPLEPVKVPGESTGLVLEQTLHIGIEEGDEKYMFA
jgi:hypothetical protein